MCEALTRAHVLSNGEYAVLLTPAGGGYAALRGYAITAWSPDPTVDHGGTACYIRDRTSLAFWSLGHMPTARLGAIGFARTLNDRVQHSVLCNGIDAYCETALAGSLNADSRIIKVTNSSPSTRTIDITTFAELALNTPSAYAAHPAFAKLFIQTAYDAERNALIAWRRPRSPDDRGLWVAQRMIVRSGQVEYDTDRAHFVGRARSVRDPAAMHTLAPLRGTVGTVLDPAFCLRTSLELPAYGTGQVEILTYAADSQDQLEDMLGVATVSRTATPSLEQAVSALGLPKRWQQGLTFGDFDYTWSGTARCPASATQDGRTSYGAFSESGAEYVMKICPTRKPTPQPWINVIANEHFGCLVSEMGAGYSWAGNSRENRITPWMNDAVADPHNEALYLRDNESGEFWSVLPGPAPAASEYEVRHGFGYSRFTSKFHELEQEACVFVPQHDPLRIVRLKLTNHSDRTRDLSLISYAQLVLGSGAAETRASVVTEYDAARGVVYATNACRGEYSEHVTFATAITNSPRATRRATASRASFLGAQGDAAAPAAMGTATLDERFGSGLDPCAALQLDVTIPAGETIECAFLLGEGDHHAAAKECIARYATFADIETAFSEIKEYWRNLVAGVQVRTPVRALDLMLNGWLVYQNLSCRMWARSAFYQSGGAFGFRDQLQDSSALLYLDPQVTRDQILLHAAHQFSEGDVLHWWHPPTSKGIRTRFSDDLLWLPYITLFYVASTGDHGILAETVRYITAARLEADDDEIFVWPEASEERGSLYEHCCRALDRSLTRGAHGLPLMGVGDWNDGMNRVGREGRGESVWLGFFLFDILHDFIPLCEQRGDTERSQRYAAYVNDLGAALNDTGWDGEWYRRAYYDDGAPLGSAQSDECKIDALAQAWAVLSRAAPAERAQRAIAAMKQHLVSEQEGIIRLLAPAFDRTPHDPGYIKGYVPGVRENGGQYTHAAVWAVRALAELNDREHAATLLELLTPVSHTRTAAQVETYRGEPYVVAADVYGVAPHIGRAGWTWYTGSAGWLYRVLLESILGFRLENGTTISLRPCIPAGWPGFTLSYRFPDGTRYTFVVEQCGEVTTTTVGVVRDAAIVIAATDDGRQHEVRIQLGRDVGPRYVSRLQPTMVP